MHICSPWAKEVDAKDAEEKAEYKDLSARCVISAEIRKSEVKNRLCKVRRSVR